MTNSTEKLSGRERSMLRRQQMSKTGSAGMKKAGRVKPRGRQSAVVANPSQELQSNTTVDTTDDKLNNINTQQ